MGPSDETDPSTEDVVATAGGADVEVPDRRRTLRELFEIDDATEGDGSASGPGA